MAKRNYSEEFKEGMIRKVLTRGEKTIKEIAEEAGIHRSLLDLWRRERAMGGTGNGRKRRDRRLQDWTAEEKLQAVLESEAFSPEELGVYLRKKGLHSVPLKQWKQEVLEALQKRKGPGRPKHTELLESQKQVKELQRELRRKEKALAEVTALLILKKKAALIWGKEEEDAWD